MKRLFYLLLPLIFLTISVPWFFVDSSDKKILGFPHWVAFSILGASVPPLPIKTFPLAILGAPVIV